MKRLTDTEALRLARKLEARGFRVRIIRDRYRKPIRVVGVSRIGRKS